MMNIQSKTALSLEHPDFAAAFNDHISAYVISRINRFDFSYRPLPNFKRDQWLRTVVEALA